MRQVSIKPAIDQEFCTTGSKQCKIKLFIGGAEIKTIIVFWNCTTKINPVISFIHKSIRLALGTTYVFVLYITGLKVWSKRVNSVGRYFSLGLIDTFVYKSIMFTDRTADCSSCPGPD